MTPGGHQRLGGTCHMADFEGPSFDPKEKNLVRCYIKLVVPCTSIYAWQVKDPTHGVNVYHFVDAALSRS